MRSFISGDARPPAQWIERSLAAGHRPPWLTTAERDGACKQYLPLKAPEAKLPAKEGGLSNAERKPFHAVRLKIMEEFDARPSGEADRDFEKRMIDVFLGDDDDLRRNRTVVTNPKTIKKYVNALISERDNTGDTPDWLLRARSSHP